MTNISTKDEFLVKQAFRHLNSFKRFRALCDQERERNNTTKVEFYELQMYKTFDQLELALRAVQSEVRTNNNSTATSED